METSNSNVLDYGKLAYDRSEIAETLYRWAAGMDFVDEDELASAFTEDVVFDFSPAGKKLGLNIPVLTSRDVVVKALTASSNFIHTISNIQATINGDSATVKAYVTILPSLSHESSPSEHPSYTLMVNRCYGDLVRDGNTWRIKHWTLDNISIDGNPA